MTGGPALAAGLAGLAVILLAGVPRLGVPGMSLMAWIDRARSVWPRRAEREGEVLELVTALVAELDTGVPPEVALLNAASTIPGTPCPTALRAVRVGGDIPASLRADSDMSGCEGLRAVAACWEVTLGSGSGLSQALTRVGGGLRADAETRSALAAEIAAVRASARILATLPALGVVVGSWTGARPFAWLLVRSGPSHPWDRPDAPDARDDVAAPDRPPGGWALMAVLSAVLAALCVLVLTRRPGVRVVPRPTDGHIGMNGRDEPPPLIAARPTRAGGPGAGLRVSVGLLAGGAVWAVVGGLAGAICGCISAGLLPAALARLESAAERRWRAQLVSEAPLVAELLAAALGAGMPLGRCLPVVADAVGGASREVLLDVHSRCELAEPARQAWAAWQEVAGIGPLARAVARSERSGAPIAGLLRQAGADLRHAASRDALARVRRAGVQAVLPLGLCLLPAFVLLGVVPIVAALAPTALG